MPVADDVDLGAIAAATDMFTGAAIAFQGCGSGCLMCITCGLLAADCIVIYTVRPLAGAELVGLCWESALAALREDLKVGTFRCHHLPWPYEHITHIS